MGMWRAEEDARCIPLLFFTLVFKTRSLIKSEALTVLLRLTVQGAPGIHLLLPPPTLRLQVLMSMFGLCLGAGDLNSGSFDFIVDILSH